MTWVARGPFSLALMNQPKVLKTRAQDEPLCSLLVGFNFLFFTGLVALMLILPLKSVFTGSDAGHGGDAGHEASAEVHAAAAGDADVIAQSAAGKAAYMICSTCHGNEGEGNPALHSPALAGQEEWYLKRQINNFKDGVRGTHADDLYGMQMRPMAMMLADEAKIDEVVAYISSLPAAHPVSTLGGDVSKGAAAYMLCAACHGADAEGNPAMNSPALAGLPDWYMVTQLKNFKAGVRGAHPKDIYGMQMRPMAMTLADEQAMKDVAAYINSKAVSE